MGKNGFHCLQGARKREKQNPTAQAQSWHRLVRADQHPHRHSERESQCNGASQQPWDRGEGCEDYRQEGQPLQSEEPPRACPAVACKEQSRARYQQREQHADPAAVRWPGFVHVCALFKLPVAFSIEHLARIQAPKVSNSNFMYSVSSQFSLCTRRSGRIGWSRRARSNGCRCCP